MSRERKTYRPWPFIKERTTGGKFMPPANWAFTGPSPSDIRRGRVSWDRLEMMVRIGKLTVTGHQDEAEELTREARVRFSKPPGGTS